MRNILFPLLILAALSGCQSGEELAACKGPAFALNTGRWQPTPADVQTSTQPVPGQQ